MVPPSRGPSRRGRLSARSQSARSHGDGISRIVKGALLFFVVIWAFRLWRSVSAVPRVSASLTAPPSLGSGSVALSSRDVDASRSGVGQGAESLPVHRKLGADDDRQAGGGGGGDDDDDDDDDDAPTGGGFARTAAGLFRGALMAAARTQDDEDDGADDGAEAGERRGAGGGAELVSDGGEDLGARGGVALEAEAASGGAGGAAGSSDGSSDGSSGGDDEPPLLSEDQLRAVGKVLSDVGSIVEGRARAEDAPGGSSPASDDPRRRRSGWKGMHDAHAAARDARGASPGSSPRSAPRRPARRQRQTRTPVEPMPPPVSVRSPSRAELGARRDLVVEATRRAWRGFERYAWGTDELRPLALEGASGFGGLGATPIDALDTLLMMGLDEEAARAREWVLYELNVTSETQVSVFETTIRVVGGLLAAYELSGDRLYVEKARDMATALLPAYDTGSGIPYNSIYLNNGSFHVPKGSRRHVVGLAEAGTQALELRRLSELTGDWRFAELSLGALEFLAARHPDEPLLPIAIDVRDGSLRSTKKSLGAVGDSYFEYLLKLWLASGKTEESLRARWQASVDAALDQLLARSTDGHLYVAEHERRRPRHRMDHLACFYPGSLALGIAEGAVRGGPAVEARYLAVAEGLAATCWAMYARQKTELSPEFVYFDREKGMLNGARYYLQRPEAIEAFWYLFRLTGNEVYREWGWHVFQSIERRCRVEAGYHGLRDVADPKGEPDDLQQSFFLAETLKYLYLLFSEKDPFAWSEVILNTEAHPIRVASQWLPPPSRAAVQALAAKGRKAHEAGELTRAKLDASKRLRERDDAKRRQQVQDLIAARVASGDVFAAQTGSGAGAHGGGKPKLPTPRQRAQKESEVAQSRAPKILMGADAIARIMRDADDAAGGARGALSSVRDGAHAAGAATATLRRVMNDEDLGAIRVMGRRGIHR